MIRFPIDDFDLRLPDDYNPACIMSFMHCRLITVCLFLMIFPLSCTPETPQPSLQTIFYVFRFDPPALIEFSADFQERREIPFSVPPQCGLFNLYAPPVGKFLAIELSCPNGQTVLFMDTDTDFFAQPITDTDSHYLAWAPNGSAVYFKVDSLGSPRVVRVSTKGTQNAVPITEFTYDLAASGDEGEFTFSFSGGLGQGSELWLARRYGSVVEPLYADPLHYISFARYSPDGRQIAFVKIPDTQTTFTVGELWAMNSDGSGARKLAEADAGHGYAASWSPDGARIAFVVRENPDDDRADQASEALHSNIYVVDVQTGALTQITHFEDGRAETPLWSPRGNTLAFNVVINDRMTVHIADLATGEIRPLITETSCCPAWMRK
jgi:dipeptidyl aminopeptidase/acylaminoacyl peptidase